MPNDARRQCDATFNVFGLAHAVVCAGVCSCGWLHPQIQSKWVQQVRQQLASSVHHGLRRTRIMMQSSQMAQEDI